MPTGKHKSRTFRRVFRKTPGGDTKIAYRRRKPARVLCAECGQVLHGFKQLRPSQVAHTAKSKRRPERPYGGVLCSRCSREKIKQMMRK